MIKRLNNIFIVGSFPPPVHGMSSVNVAIRDALLKSKKSKILVFNTSSYTLNRGFFGKFNKLLVFIFSYIAFFCNVARKKKVLYIGISGGLGQIYDFLFIITARLFSFSIFLHHHSFSYVNRYSLFTKLILFVSGKKTINILIFSDL